MIKSTLVDITGNRYTLAAPSSNELAEWTDMIRSTSIQLAKEIIRRGDTIRLNCLARNENQTNGYTVVNLDKHGIQLNFFMLKVCICAFITLLKLLKPKLLNTAQGRNTF